MPSFDKKPDENPFHASTSTSDGPFAGASVWESSPVDNALASATKDLDGGGGLLGRLFGASEKQAGHALKALTGLPPDQQGEAIAKLSPAQFQSLIKNTSIEDRERMLGLVKNTTDPERKLELFGAYHKAHATLDAERHEDDPTLTADDRKQRARNRRDAAAGTSGEVDDEMKFLKAKQGGFALEDVDQLMARKTREHDIEMKHALQLTNQRELRDDRVDRVNEVSRNTNTRSHVHWSTQELDQIDYTLDQLPRDHVSGLTELRRDDKKPGSISNMAYYDVDRQNITVVDRGAAQKDQAYTSIGEAHQLGGGDKSRMSSPVHRLEHSLAHEIGHHVAHAKNPSAFEKYTNVGWKNRIDLNALDNKGRPTASTVLHDGTVPSPDRAGTERVEDPYAYAKKSPDEAFGEHYAKAVNRPEKLHEDMVSTPRKDREGAEAAVKQLQSNRAKDLASKKPGMTTAEWDEEIRVATEKVTQAKEAERIRKEQFDIMRNDVFGTGKAQLDSEARLASRLDAGQMKAFRDQAAKASTPAQLRRIEESFAHARVGALPEPQKPPKPWTEKKKPKPRTPPRSGGGCADGP